MKTRLLWTLILGVGLTALFFGITQPHVSLLPSEVRNIEDLKPPILPPLEPPPLVIPETPTLSLPVFTPSVRVDPIPPRPEVPIQDRATIDFSTGAPVVRTHGKDQDALERALREISEVLKDAKLEAKK